MSDPARIEELVAAFIERREEGELLDPGEFAAEQGGVEGLLAALERALSALALFPTGAAPVDRPERIGPWRVLEELGRGGAGRVFRVSREGQDEECALKLLNLSAVGNPRALERFAREGKILEGLDHPGIVRVHQVSAGDELPYIVMDLLPGQALSARLALARRELRTSRVERTPPTDLLRLPGRGDTITRAARVVAELARAVQFAHDQGLLHRDLKPSNVLLDGDGRPVLVDFGLAVSEESATLTESGDLLGTPHYMSPEQARGERADPRSDVYGLGAVLYELLTLRPPHEGHEPLEVLQRIRTRPLVPVRRLNPAVPPALARVVDRALAWKRARRTPSAATLARDLDAALAGERVSAGRRGPVERAEDLMRFRPRAVALTAVFGLLLMLAGVLSTAPSDPAQVARVDRAAQRAWFESDEQDLGAQVLVLERLAPAHPYTALYRARSNEVAAPMSDDRAVAAAIEGLLAQGEERLSDAVEAYARAHAAAPEWALPLGLSGLIDDGDRRRRIADLELATRLLPGSLRLARVLAHDLRLEGRPAEGARRLERALEDGGGDWREYSELSVCRLKAGELAAAFAAIEQALDQASARSGGPPPETVLNRKAAILDGMGQSADAERLFRELIARYPNDAGLRFNLALTLDGACRLAEAREAYLAAYALRPGDLRTLSSLAHLHAGSGYTDTGCERCQAELAQRPDLFDPDQALVWSRRALELDDRAALWLPEWIAGFGPRMDRRVQVHALLQDFIDDDGELDEYAVALERGLRKAERAREQGDDE